MYEFVVAEGNVLHRGTRWRGWLRYCATSRKVVGSAPGVVIGIFNSLNCPCRIMVIGSTHPLPEISPTDISWKVKAAGA